jgi:hypothetical protein
VAFTRDTVYITYHTGEIVPRVSGAGGGGGGGIAHPPFPLNPITGSPLPPPGFGHSFPHSRPNSELSPLMKSELLFLRFLTKEQKMEFTAKKTITVKGSAGGLYRIECTSITGNVIRIAGKRKMFWWWHDYSIQPVRYCIQLKNMNEYPIYDHLLAQKVMLECNEAHFLWAAVVSARAA